HPFGESLDFPEPLRAITIGKLAPELADKILGWTVMVRKIPARESGIMIREHFRNGSARRDRAVCSGHLPQAVQNPADPEVRSEIKTTRFGQHPWLLLPAILSGL